MNIVVRLLTSLILGAVVMFCVFGFMATFEPLERGEQITFRVIYGVSILICLGVFARMHRKKPFRRG